MKKVKSIIKELTTITKLLVQLLLEISTLLAIISLIVRSF